MTILVRDREVSFNRLKETLGGSDGGLYSHLEKLVKADYVTKKKQLSGDNVQTVYRTTRKGQNTFSEYLEFMESVLKENMPAKETDTNREEQ